MRFWQRNSGGIQPQPPRRDWVSITSLLMILAAVVVIVNESMFADARKIPQSLQEIPARNDMQISKEQYEEESLPVTGILPEAVSPIAADSRSYTVENVDLLGVSIQFRLLRESGSDAGGGPIRNVEFFIREGILPRKLFPGTSQIITHYWPLFHNNVGYGATTVRILYQFVPDDSNGDRLLDHSDRQQLATSLPDGSQFRVLDRDVGEVVDMAYLSELSELHVRFLIDGQQEQRIYSLATE